MRNTYLSILMAICGLLSAVTTNAQQEKTQNKASANSNVGDKNAIAGSYEIDKNNIQRGIIEHINVNYKLSSAPFKDVLHLDLGTSDPTSFTADIVNSKGDKL